MAASRPLLAGACWVAHGVAVIRPSLARSYLAECLCLLSLCALASSTFLPDFLCLSCFFSLALPSSTLAVISRDHPPSRLPALVLVSSLTYSCHWPVGSAPLKTDSATPPFC